jgi:hypothetical protein
VNDGPVWKCCGWSLHVGHAPDCRRLSALSDSQDQSQDPREPDHSREGIFVYHNCSRCKDGTLPCVQGAVWNCEYPHARDD